MIRFILVATFLGLFLICSLPFLLLEWIIGKFNMDFKNKSSLAIVKWAFRVCLFIAGTKVTVIGEENVPVDEAVLYVGNHRSYFDILLTYVRVPRPCGYIAKKEMFRYPILRRWMQFLHCLFLDRDNIKEGLKTILEGIEKLKSGISICIFPEGTRNKTEEDFLEFKAASLKLADKSGCPIIPMVLNNTDEIFEKHMPRIIPTHVVIEYTKPIYPNQLSKEEKKNLNNMVVTQIKETYYKNKALV